MKKSSYRRGRFNSFLIGVLFCLVGIIMLIYLSKDFIIDMIREPEKSDESTQLSIPSENAIEAVPNIQINPEGSNVQQNGDITQYPNIDNRQTNIVHGNGGMSHLKRVSDKYTHKEEFVHQNVFSPLMSMIAAASNDGIDLTLVSAFRSYSHQKRIWENKWGSHSEHDVNKASSILRYSSFPGTSRHHWGTDVDFNSVSLDFWNSPKGRHTHAWLVNNAPNYGFCQVYASGRTQGYADEPWHWSHMPTANGFFAQMSQPEVFNIALSQNIKGAAAARQMPDHMMGYVRSISACRPSSQGVDYENVTVASHRQVAPRTQRVKNNTQQSVGSSRHLTDESSAYTPIYSENNEAGMRAADRSQNNIPKPPLPRDNGLEPGPIFEKQDDSHLNVSSEKHNAVKIGKGSNLD